MSRASYLRALLAACAVGVLARALAVALVPTAPVSDFWAYFDNATHLLAGDPYPNTDYPPGYPAFLDLCFLLAPVGARLLAVKIGNVLLGAGTIALAGKLAREGWGERAAVATAWLAALCPMLVLLPCLVASENLFIPLAFALALAVRRSWDEPRSLRWAAIAGLLVGIAALVRGLGYLMGAVWLLGLFARGKRWSAVLCELGLLLLVQHTVMLPWGLLNLREHGRFELRTSNGGTSLFIGNNPWTTGSFSADWPSRLQQLEPSLADHPLDAWELDALSARAARRWMRENPGQALRLYLRKLRQCLKGSDEIVFWAALADKVAPPPEAPPVVPGPHFLKTHERAARRASVGVAAVLLALGVLGLAMASVQGWRRRSERKPLLDVALLAGLALYSPLVSAVFVATGRYRWPTEALALVFAGIALSRLLVRRGGSAT